MEKHRIERRLADLQNELNIGRHTLADLEDRSKTVQLQILRISGAIQVLEELLADENAKEREAGHSVNGAVPHVVPAG